MPQSSWRLAGLGVRVAQDMGAHRRKSRDTVPTAEDETMKRAFWCASPLYVCEGANSLRTF